LPPPSTSSAPRSRSFIRRSPSRCNDQPSAIGSFPESGPWFTHRDTNENLVRLSGRVALLLVGVRGCPARSAPQAFCG
jgi:hypothetical protein